MEEEAATFYHNLVMWAWRDGDVNNNRAYIYSREVRAELGYRDRQISYYPPSGAM